MIIKKNKNLTVGSILQSRECKANDSLPKVLLNINNWAEKVAKDIGGALSKEHAWKNLGWFFTQYRGTMLSGERSFMNFYHKQGLGTPEENDALLGIYWKTYGLGSTIGELFETRCSLEKESPME